MANLRLLTTKGIYYNPHKRKLMWTRQAYQETISLRYTESKGLNRQKSFSFTRQPITSSSTQVAQYLQRVKQGGINRKLCPPNQFVRCKMTIESPQDNFHPFGGLLYHVGGDWLCLGLMQSTPILFQLRQPAYNDRVLTKFGNQQNVHAFSA